MSKPKSIDRLWKVTSSQTGIDRSHLQEIVGSIDDETLDARSRELILASRQALAGESTEETAFPSLSSRLIEPMKKTLIEQYLRELGTRLQHKVKLIIGGSSALILLELLSRATEDIDVVDEVPEPLREMHKWRARAQTRYGLYIAHFQSHYLPQGWSERLHSRGNYGKLEVFVVDPVDIFVGKLFSRREKDLDDLRVLSSTLDRESIVARLSAATALLSDEDRRRMARDNYYIVYGEGCPI
jgi:Nucleotidyltransferase of unknown function (DUF6036)